MSTKNINFDDKKKSKKVNFKGTEKYFRQMILMLIKYQFLKKALKNSKKVSKKFLNTAQRMRLNTLQDIMIIMVLDRYA